MAEVEAALQGRFLVGLRDAAEAVVREQVRFRAGERPTGLLLQVAADGQQAQGSEGKGLLFMQDWPGQIRETK